MQTFHRFSRASSGSDTITTIFLPESGIKFIYASAHRDQVGATILEVHGKKIFAVIEDIGTVQNMFPSFLSVRRFDLGNRVGFHDVDVFINPNLITHVILNMHGPEITFQDGDRLTIRDNVHFPR